MLLNSQRQLQRPALAIDWVVGAAAQWRRAARRRMHRRSGQKFGGLPTVAAAALERHNRGIHR